MLLPTKESLKNVNRDLLLQYITFGFRVIVGVIFIFSSITKAIDVADFAQTITRWNILPEQYSFLAAIVLIVIEYLLGVLFVLGLSVRKAGTGMSILLLIFIFAIIYNLARGHVTSCGCFGTLAER